MATRWNDENSPPRSNNNPSPPEDDEPQYDEIERKRKRKEKKSLKKALQENQIIVADQREQLKHLSQENERLKAQQNNEDTSSDEEGPKKKKRTGDIGALKTDALQAGKKFTVCDKLWLKPGTLGYISLLADSREDEDLSNVDDDDDDDESAEAKAEAEVLFKALPAQLRPYVGTGWFRERFNEGCKSIRSTTVFDVTALFPGFIIPDMSPVDFADRVKRTKIPQVLELLDNNRFLYDRNPKSLKDRREGHLRNSCILKILMCLLNGPSSVKQGTKSTRARKTNGDIWGCKSVNIPMMAFAATVALFILSGESEFTEQGSQHGFLQFYNTRIELLTKESEKRTKKNLFKLLVDDLNKNLFDVDVEENTMNDEERALLEAIEADDSESGSDHETNDN